jgi:hypothetical protein
MEVSLILGGDGDGNDNGEADGDGDGNEKIGRIETRIE